MAILLQLGGWRRLEYTCLTAPQITCSTSINSAVYKRTGQVRSQITPSDVGARLGRRRSVCKIERDQNLQIIARGSSASNGPSETEQVEKLHSIAGDGGNGDGIGGSGGDGGDNEDGDDKNQPLAPGAGLWFRYTELLDRHPLIVKSLTAGLLNAIADLVCQVLVERVSAVDLRRLLSFVAIGLFMSGPGLHYWFGILKNFVTVPGMGGVLLRTAADQLVFTPLGVVGFFVVLLNLEGRQAELPDKLRKDVIETVIANWKVWIPFQLVNFGFVPPQLQVAAAGVLGMVWSVFIDRKSVV